MFRLKFASLVLAGGVLFAGQGAFADDQSKQTSAEIEKVRTFVDEADLTLAEAIKKAEQHCNGKAIHAAAMCDHDHSSSGVKKAHYKVCCLTSGTKITEVCLDSKEGTVLASHERTSLPDDFRMTSAGSFTKESGSKISLRTQKASDLIGKPVENTRGDRLGEVQDLAINPDNGRVVYAVLSFGGFLGMGEKWFAIPSGALTLPDHCKHFVLAVSEDRLKNATGFDKDRWPKMGDPAWGTGIHEFYGIRPYWLDESQTSPSTEFRIQKASEIIGRTVQNDRGESIGDIKDLVIDPDRSRIVYGVLSFGGVMGLGDKLFAIPPGALQMPGTAGFAVLTVDKDRLKNASGFDKNNWPNMADVNYAVTTYEFYGQRPYWTNDWSMTKKSDQ